MAGLTVFLDANAIIEAHRAKCWKAIAGFHDIITAQTVVIECETGDRLRRDYVPVDTDLLKSKVRVIEPSGKERIHLQLRLGGAVALDEGERDLLACAIVDPGAWCVCSPDNNSVRAAVRLGIHERLVSLEKLAHAAGVKADLKMQYREKWLRIKITQFLLEE